MRILRWLTALAALLGSAADAAALDLGAGLASDEVFRGLSQNNSLTASLRADARFDHRFLLGGRALNNRRQGELQTDAYFGYSWPLDLFDLLQARADAGLSASLFHGKRGSRGLADPDYLDAYANLGVGPLRFSASAAPDYWGTGALGYRLAGQLKWPLPMPGLGLIGVLGWNGGDGVRRLVASRQAQDNGCAYVDYSLMLVQELPAAWAAYLQVAGSSAEIDGSRAPTLVVGLRWRYGI